MQPCNSFHTTGSRFLGYRLVLYTTIICQPVHILGNDYPGMGTVEVRASQLAQASERVGSPIPTSQQG